MRESTVNPEAFEGVVEQLQAGYPLSVAMIIDVFGKDAAMLFIMALTDAQDAGRFIQSALTRLSLDDQDELEEAEDAYTAIATGV